MHILSVSEHRPEVASLSALREQNNCPSFEDLISKCFFPNHKDMVVFHIAYFRLIGQQIRPV